MSVEELRRLKSPEVENKRLKSLVADLSLDKQILQDALSKKLASLLVCARPSKQRCRLSGSASSVLASS